jgi:hypothetical protein
MGILYDTGLLTFLILTVVLGGGAAWMAGRAIASTWRPAWQIVPYMALLGLAIRFLHYALFGGTLLSIHYYLVDTVVLLIAGFVGFRLKRTSQMVTQYRWLYERTGLFTWRERRSTIPAGS